MRAIIIAIILLAGCTQAQIQKEIQKANYCNNVEECVNIGSKCPFGCDIHVNEKEAERIRQLVGSYESNCVYGCAECEVQCVNNKCVCLS
jgi:hypothetical protein